MSQKLTVYPSMYFAIFCLDRPKGFSRHVLGQSATCCYRHD